MTEVETQHEPVLPPWKTPLYSCTAEHATNKPVPCKIQGTIPDWLEGSLFRNGAGIFQVGATTLNHLFDGMAFLHRFTINNGKVTYMSSVLDSETWKSSIKANRLMATQVGTYEAPDPCKTKFEKLTTTFFPKLHEEHDATDNCCVHLVPHGDTLYAMTETPWVHRVDKDSMKSLGRDFIPDAISVHTSTAHPHFEDGNMYNLGTCFKPPNNYNIIKFPPKSDPREPLTARAELVCSLRSRWNLSLHYNHSFGMTRHHFVLLEQPISLKTLGFVTEAWTHKTPLECFTLHPEEDLVFRLVSRHTSKETSIKYVAPTCFTFHFVNCYEIKVPSSGDRPANVFLVIDLVGYTDLNIWDDLLLENLDKKGYSESTPALHRYVLPLSLTGAKPGENLVTLPDCRATAKLREDGSVFLTPDTVTQAGVAIELPRINDAFNGRLYRYCYGNGMIADKHQLVKVDYKARTESIWREAGFQPGEPVFVPTPGGTDENDGVILSPCISLTGEQPCFLVVLDAKTFTELGRATAPADIRMPLSFHGSFIEGHKAAMTNGHS